MSRFTIYVADASASCQIKATKSEIIAAANEMWRAEGRDSAEIEIARVQTVDLTKSTLIDILTSYGGSYEAERETIGTVVADPRKPGEPRFVAAT